MERGARVKKGYFYPFSHLTADGWSFDSMRYDLWTSVLISPLIRYYEVTGYKKAFQLAEGLANYIVYASTGNVNFGWDGSFIGHFHATMWSVLGVLKYAFIVQDEKIIEWCRKIYRWALHDGSTFGWFPEGVGGNRKSEGCETCCIKDMVRLALTLAKNGDERCCGDVERMVRNQLIENQLTSVDWLPMSCRKEDTDRDTYDEVAQRARGGFFAITASNDLQVHREERPHFVCGCCSVTGTEALYLVWDSIVEKRPDGVYVNFAISRSSPWVDVISYHPHEGKVSLIVRDAEKIFLRIPEWAGRHVSLAVDYKPWPIEWIGDYIHLTDLKKGQQIDVTYPMRKFEENQQVAEIDLFIKWIGNTIVEMKPDGNTHPLYQRSVR